MLEKIVAKTIVIVITNESRKEKFYDKVIKPWLERRIQLGVSTLHCNLHLQEEQKYTNYLRMNPDYFG